MNKSINTLVIILFSIIGTFTVNAQNSCFIEYKTGEKVEADVKGFHSLDKKIKFKNLETGKKVKVLSEELESITFETPDQTYIFKRMTVKALSPFGKLKELKRPGWVAKLYGTDKMEGYLYMSSDYNISLNSFGGTKHNTFLSSAQAIKLTSEDYVFYIGLKKLDGWGGKRTVRILMNNMLIKYLKDFCPQFTDNMDKNTYEVNELQKIVDEYTAQCN